MRSKPGLFLLASCFLSIACNNETDTSHVPATAVSAQPAAIPVINYSVTAYLPHDTALFTEGFLVHNGQLFESTGSPEEFPDAESLVGIIDPHTGKLDQKIRLDKEEYFGEGIAFLKDKLYQLTYLNQKGFIYDAVTFKKTGEFTFASKQGWGLTTDGAHLIMDDSSDVLTFLDPSTLKAVKTLKVTMSGIARDSLNELEFIKGYIYANVWYTNYILKIDPATGKVIARLDLSSIVADARNKNPRANVLNGIAYDPASDKIYVVGKRWPNIYQIDFPH
ncbi:glutaminyl-peptide cyclotransferase [Flavitalea sp. BT771]|uniref:glutaminyl-peptide cyclotransferase n=1 Tax=Flavitalea sp. BT771 TaxID=3063329 RepID=UPI0026E25FB8|nr:glutaminyl-peptide cyclotransferase [Flavitalea sp. BT771]MDO6431740.1 glutaminyl-peptide cyclotransferase [Flavitalea sp. BT771]MDV6220648.1 glutaminyl-peptide cyclotransferase [Flavitalea sp. BT771]